MHDADECERSVPDVRLIEPTDALVRVTRAAIFGRTGKSQTAMFGSIARATPARDVHSKRHTSSNP